MGASETTLRIAHRNRNTYSLGHFLAWFIPKRIDAKSKSLEIGQSVRIERKYFNPRLGKSVKNGELTEQIMLGHRIKITGFAKGNRDAATPPIKRCTYSKRNNRFTIRCINNVVYYMTCK